MSQGFVRGDVSQTLGSRKCTRGCCQHFTHLPCALLPTPYLPSVVLCVPSYHSIVSSYRCPCLLHAVASTTKAPPCHANFAPEVLPGHALFCLPFRLYSSTSEKHQHSINTLAFWRYFFLLLFSFKKSVQLFKSNFSQLYPLLVGGFVSKRSEEKRNLSFLWNYIGHLTTIVQFQTELESGCSF